MHELAQDQADRPPAAPASAPQVAARPSLSQAPSRNGPGGVQEEADRAADRQRRPGRRGPRARSA